MFPGALARGSNATLSDRETSPIDVVCETDRSPAKHSIDDCGRLNGIRGEFRHLIDHVGEA
jgi:hypothetical protein